MCPSDTDPRPVPRITAVVVEHELRFTLPDLARASRADPAWLRALVDEGALQPLGGAGSPEEPWFGPEALRRARRARRLGRDLDLGAPEAALVLDLLDQIDDLRRRLAAAGL